MSRPALFVDRDGTVNREVGYLSRPEDLELIPGAGPALARACAHGLVPVVVTNQSGVARGLFDEATLERIHARLRSLLAREGVTLGGIYVCPHHPEGLVPAYRRTCRCRKPGTALVERAAEELDLDLSASYVVGDHFKDVRMGVNAGMPAVLVLTGHGRPQWDRADAEERRLAAHVAPDLEAAVGWILEHRRGRAAERGGPVMEISKELLDILACPKCKGPLVPLEDPEGLACRPCGLRYPIRDRIPILLIEEAEPLET